MTMLATLTAGRETGLFSDIDVELALGLCNLVGESSAAVALLVALTSHDLSQGHVCLALHTVCARVNQSEEAPCWAPLRGMGIVELSAALQRSALCGGPEATTPLCLHGARLYLRRYYAHEDALASELLGRAKHGVRSGPDMGAAVARLFPPSEPEVGQLDLLSPATEDKQRAAAEAALRNRLTVISGGPGTGKTSTVVKVLSLLVEQAEVSGQEFPRITLLAPTGKAAARLAEAISSARDKLAISEVVRRHIPTEATTIHRALEARPGSGRFGRNRERPLPADVVLVDEASMVDLSLMRRLLEAVTPQAQLILLGDRDQLVSVEAGAVLGDVCGAGLALNEMQDSPMAGCLVQLTRSYRYGESSGIGQLARAIRQGRAKDVLAVLASKRLGDVSLRPALSSAEGGAGYVALRGFFGPFVSARSDAAAHRALSAFRILCAHRSGPEGVSALNQMVEQGLTAARRAQGGFYAGRPVMVLRNDHALRLYNGDVGIALPSAAGDLRVSFEDGGEGFRYFAPSRLPRNESVYAMTVHKSQGSEFDHVAIVLPAEVTPLLSRELLYTAVTRAKKKVTVFGSEDAVVAAVETPIERRSGLRERLWGK